jgi:signal transduction histidine kinase
MNGSIQGQNSPENSSQTNLSLAEQSAVVERIQESQKSLLKVISKIRASLELDTIFKVAAIEVRQLLNADRVGVFRFYPDSGYDDGEFVSEDVLPGYDSALAAKVHDHCFGDRYAIHYAEGRIQAVADIYNAGLSDCHIQVLSQFQIKANLIVPLRQGNNLWGLLCIHQCSTARDWKLDEIEFVSQIAEQLGIAIQQAELLAQVMQQSEELSRALRELQQTQTHLIQTEKMSSLGQLVAGVAHEINNPVNFIYGNLNHATDYIQDLLGLLGLYRKYYPHPVAEIRDRCEEVDLDFLTDDLPKILSSMKTGADRIRQIVLSLRSFSRFDQADMKAVDIHEGIDSTLMILQHRLRARTDDIGIEVIKEYGTLPPVHCLAGQLNQVFMNLLSNAIDALQEAGASSNCPGQIRIRTMLKSDPERPHAVIRVSDNGPGIPVEIQERIFDPFFTTKPVGQGTGLGLSISYQIVTERHGGSLRCRSEVGKGTEFWIEIPLQQAESIPAVLSRSGN